MTRPRPCKKEDLERSTGLPRNKLKGVPEPRNNLEEQEVLKVKAQFLVWAQERQQMLSLFSALWGNMRCWCSGRVICISDFPLTYFCVTSRTLPRVANRPFPPFSSYCKLTHHILWVAHTFLIVLSTLEIMCDCGDCSKVLLIYSKRKSWMISLEPFESWS